MLFSQITETLAESRPSAQRAGHQTNVNEDQSMAKLWFGGPNAFTAWDTPSTHSVCPN